MERNSTKKALPPAQPPDPVHQTKSVNPRGPHYGGGTYSQHSSSTSSSHTSLSNSSSTGYSQQSDQLLQDPRYERQYPGRPAGGDHGYYQQQYSDTRHGGFIRQQHTTSQYPPPPERTSYDNYVPMGYYQPYDQQREYDYQHQPSDYRPSLRQHGHLTKAYSEETFREVRQYDSERGFSSLGDAPNRVPYHRQDPPLRQPLAKYQTEYPEQYRETSPSSAQYSHGSGAPEVTRTEVLSERIERMKIIPASDIEILKQPVDQVVNLNECVVFMCKARVNHCKEDPNILWFKNREPLIGEIDSTYVIKETTEKDAGVYHCLITHPLNTSFQKESYAATLTINKKGIYRLISV